jgi:signal transduction histidine kinase
MPLVLSPHQWNIKAKSVALVAVYVFALCAIYSGFTVYLVRRESTKAHERFRQTADMVAARLDAYVAFGHQRLTTVAQLPGLVYGLRTIQEAHDEGYIPPWTTLHYLFLQSPVLTDGVFLLGRTGKVLWTEPPGLPWRDHIITDFPEIFALSQTEQGFVSPGHGADGLFDRPHVVVAVPIQNPDGEVDGVLGGVIDLTGAGLANVLGGVSTAQGRFVEVVDQDGRVLASTSQTRLLQPFPPMSPQEDPPLLVSATLSRAPWRVVAGQPQTLALAEVSQLQRLLWGLGVGVMLIAIVSGAPFINGFVRPIQQLTVYAEQMAGGDLSQPVIVGRRRDEIATLAQAFEHMRVELERSHAALEQRLEEREELIRLKEEFLANISHELRTPLHIIMGYSDMLSSSELDLDQREMLTRIRSKSEHLAHLLSDLMTASQLNTGKITLEVRTVKFPDLFARLLPLTEQLRQGKDVEVVWDCPSFLPPLETDALRLEQVLTSLITNAFKFTPKGQVAVRACALAAQEQVRVEVTDTGIGIPAQEIPFIFDEFRQVDGSASRTYGGMGLGLALVKKLVTLLRGEIAVTSQEGKGSTFTIALPLR